MLPALSFRYLCVWPNISQINTTKRRKLLKRKYYLNDKNSKLILRRNENARFGRPEVWSCHCFSVRTLWELLTLSSGDQRFFSGWFLCSYSVLVWWIGLRCQYTFYLWMLCGINCQIAEFHVYFWPQFLFPLDLLLDDYCITQQWHYNSNGRCMCHKR